MGHMGAINEKLMNGLCSPPRRDATTKACRTNKAVVSVSSDGSIKRWDLGTSTGKCAGSAELSEYRHTVRYPVTAFRNNYLSFSPDGKHVAIASQMYGGDAGGIKILSVETGACEQTLRGHADRVETVCFGGSLLVSACVTGTIKVWRIADGELLHTRTYVYNKVNTIAFHLPARPSAAVEADTRLGWYCLASKEGTLSVHALGTGALRTTLNHQGYVEECWRRRYAFKQQAQRDRADTITSVCFSGCGDKVAAVSLHFGVRVWAMAADTHHATAGTGTTVSTLDVEGPHHVICMAFSPCHDMLAITKYGGEISVWPVQHHRPFYAARCCAMLARMKQGKPRPRALRHTRRSCGHTTRVHVVPRRVCPSPRRTTLVLEPGCLPCEHVTDATLDCLEPGCSPHHVRMWLPLYLAGRRALRRSAACRSSLVTPRR